MDTPINHHNLFSSSESNGSFSLDSPEEVPRVDDATMDLSSVRRFVEDQRNVDPDKLMPYIFMLARGVHDEIPKEIDISGVDCLKKGLEQKVLKKRAITLTKPLLCLELKRRDDKVKPNMNNKKVEDLFAMINETDLEEGDKEFVKEMTSGFISDIKKAIDESDARIKETGGRIEMTDHLHWIMAIDAFGDIRIIAYMGLQDVLNREQLDARNTASPQADFHDLVVAKVNDESWVPDTMAIPDLHSTFAEPISCPKREYFNLTRERSKTLLVDFKHKLNEICKRYDQSGNGSGQLDSDGVEVERTDERDFGRVNLELAKQKGCDDRQAFLQHEPVDLLYYWDIMDHHDLIHFTTAQLRGSNAVSSESRPARTSYNASDSDSSGPRPRKKLRNGNDGDDVAQKMNDNVSKVGDAMIEMNKQSMLFEINALWSSIPGFFNSIQHCDEW
jgi:hypothetical protein